jgi:hypothetical protein
MNRKELPAGIGLMPLRKPGANPIRKLSASSTSH